jgi:hypothetical protein
VRFRNGDLEKVTTTNTTRIAWADYPDGPAVSTYAADDLELLT